MRIALLKRANEDFTILGREKKGTNPHALFAADRRLALEEIILLAGVYNYKNIVYIGGDPAREAPLPNTRTLYINPATN